MPFKTIEAVRSGWDAAAPPAAGWTSVTLPDDWATRWPGFDGVVWYRLTFDRPDAAEPLGLALNYWTLA
ncbi:histidine kinase, partial [Mesorhizobium sp. M7A.F.Ca.CA.001.13.2.1]